MKKLFALIVTFGFVSNAFADDWRMRKFDLNADEFITKDELMAAGCNYKATTFEFCSPKFSIDNFIVSLAFKNC